MIDMKKVITIQSRRQILLAPIALVENLVIVTAILTIKVELIVSKKLD